MNLQRLTSWSFPDITTEYSHRDTMLYALGVGCARDALDPTDLSFVYEGNLQALPSMSCVLAHPGFWIKAKELEVNWVKLVHAEQWFHLEKPLPAKGALTGKYRVTGVVDKGPGIGALMYFEKTLHASDGSRIGTVGSTYFLRGDGGCGNWGEPAPELPTLPTEPPAGTIEIPILPIAALVYRLSGDYNPLHADPEIARKAGFPKPIFQGLGTFGVACQALVRAVCGNNAARLSGMGARFTKPVYPGETIRTEFWNGADGTVRFRCVSVERGEVVLDRGTAAIRT